MKNPIQYWDKIAFTKEFTTSLDEELIRKYAQKDDLIVDYGCGYGRTLNQLHQLGYSNLIGFDIAPKMIERGKAEFPFLELYNSQKILTKPNSVDMALLFAVLTCIISNEEQKQLISEIAKTLKPGGIIYINDFLLNSDERNLERYEKYYSKYGVYGAFELDEGATLRHHSEE